MTISEKFSNFCDKIEMDDQTISNIIYRYHQITKRINKDYWDIDSDTYHSLYVGSYGRGTEIYASDIDMLVQLPYSIYQKFNNYSGNKQSAFLQDVKKTIEKTYSTSFLKGDGQIISLPFTDGINFEVLPAFVNNDDSFTYANTNNGGEWRVTDPRAEIKAINDMNSKCNYNLKRLCKMARAWKHNNDVDISGILIDVLAYNFMDNWIYKDKSFLYYDYMTRDFFDYVRKEEKSQYKWKVMGSNRYIYCYGSFQNKADKAYKQALDAIEYEGKQQEYSANLKWREIYGNKF